MEHPGTPPQGFNRIEEVRNIGSIQVVKIRASRRGVPFPATLDSLSQPFLYIFLNNTGVGCFWYRKKLIRLKPAEWCVFEETPLNVTAQSHFAELVALIVPRNHLGADLDISATFARPFSGSAGIRRLLDYLAPELYEEIPRIDSKNAEDLAQVLFRLIKIALREALAAGSPRVSAQQKLRNDARQQVESCLRDSSTISVARIAEALGTTRRKLQRAFQDNGETLCGYISARRLDRCHSDLIDPKLADRTITQIALDRGFNNVTHFSAAFRMRFGYSPRQARRMN
jgi:AraC-like DNA-binding protein